VLVATALAATVLRERVTVWRAGGAALVVAGIVLLAL
jgi:drug/metabolite transporter (DMT)-like permease